MNGENKEQLIKLIFEYVEKLNKKNLLGRPIFTTGDQTYRLENGQSDVLHECNHEEADTRLVLHAFLEKGDVVVACKDRDVLILMVWAYTYYGVSNEWYV